MAALVCGSSHRNQAAIVNRGNLWKRAGRATRRSRLLQAVFEAQTRRASLPMRKCPAKRPHPRLPRNVRLMHGFALRRTRRTVGKRPPTDRRQARLPPLPHRENQRRLRDERAQDWTLYPVWCDAMRRLGYAIAPHIIDAADPGVPQTGIACLLFAPARATQSSSPCQNAHTKPSATSSNWIPTRGRLSTSLDAVPLCCAGSLPAALSSEIASSRRYYSSGSGLTGRSIARPIGTITTCDR